MTELCIAMFAFAMEQLDIYAQCGKNFAYSTPTKTTVKMLLV